MSVSKGLESFIGGGNGKPKGNCDVDLVLQATQDFYEKAYDKAIFVSAELYGNGEIKSSIGFMLHSRVTHGCFLFVN